MRRSAKRPLISILLFSIALLVIIYLNRAGPKKLYAWTKIRYVSKDDKFPEPNGVCPKLSSTTKPALVVSRVTADGDEEWLNDLKDRYHLCIYTVDQPYKRSNKFLQVPANRGHEAMAYLTYIIDNYDDLPRANVFIHGTRFAWHNDHPAYDNAALLRDLNVSRALDPHGYANLKCDWSASTCEVRKSPPQGSLETSMRAATEPWNDRVVSDSLLPKALAGLFGGQNANREDLLLGRADAVRSQCCAQFVVSREQILGHAKGEYAALRQWLLDGTSAPKADRVAGRIISYLWHILFLVNTDLDEGVDLDELNQLACPDASDCYCKLYGRCGLSGCTEGYCNHQYSVPPGFTLPENWAATHS